MVEICEFRNAKLTYGSDNVSLTVMASIKETWETVDYPLYLEQSAVGVLPTLKKITVKIRRRYQPSSPLHAGLDGSGLSLVFESGGEFITFTDSKVIEWKVFGELGGEMMEEVVLSCQEEG